ncbi:MAG TPA: [protein-PII] uridylyltransferase [Mycobacteriales bacterium]|nr:[protein-PII] uridylyltransferase [Mycobacteriales bacterium]
MSGSREDAAESLRTARAAVLADRSVVGAALRSALCEVADAWLREQVGDENDVALVAVGGYGRREAAPGSDFDLLLLHRDRRDVKSLADHIWYPIWDAGVGLDHSVRTPAEASAVAREDLKAALGLLDARHVAGDPALTEQTRAAVLADWRRDARRRLPELAQAVRERADRSGELAFLLEPDLKECRGGLRDVHAMRAAAAAWVVDAPDERVRSAHARLLDVRGELHRRSNRPTDRLLLQEQLPLAEALGFDDADALMRDVYDAGRAIAFASDETWRRVEAAVRPARPARRWRSRGGDRPQSQRRPLADDVVEQDGEVVLARDAQPAADAVLQLRVAAAAAQSALPISRHTLHRLSAESASLPEPWPDEARAALVSVLEAGAPAVAVLEAFDQSGLLVRLIPEWEAVRCKPQRNAVHRFTVDRHLVEAAVEASRLSRHVARPDLLVLAALLHDIGKGFPGDHTDAGVRIVPVIARRLGLPDDDVGVLVSLVRHHLLLPDTATRRDLDDPLTVQTVADAVGDRSTLELLHALTEADALATGPAAWSDWKGRLVADLVARTRAVLAGQPPPSTTALDADQLELARAGRLAVDVSGDRVTIVAPDRPGLLWRWAGVLALHRLEIRAAMATSVDATAVTVFDVSPRFGSAPEWDRVRADVRRAYDDALSLETRLAERERAYARPEAQVVPPRVLWVDDASAASTVVEVRAHDAIGLLHRLTRALADAGLDVRSARVSTLGAEVVDAFYVLDSNGTPVDVARRDEIERVLLMACGGADAAAPQSDPRQG